MRRVVMFGLACTALVAPVTTRGQAAERKGKPGQTPQANRAGKAVAQAPDFKLVIWFDESRPLETFRYQAYDLRKNEYNKAVEDWLKMIQSRYPGYQAYARNVYLAREKGDTDALKLGSAIADDLRVTASYFGGVDLSGPPRLDGGGRLGSLGSLRPLTAPQPIGSMGSANFSSPVLSPSPPLFPVPMPYPRPHP
jgi:hypothetical protein